jgi:hypothetical protein
LLTPANFPIEASILIIKGLHARWAAFLKSIPETDWTRTAFHPENGDMKLETFLEYYAAHGRHHVEQIRKLRQRKGLVRPPQRLRLDGVGFFHPRLCQAADPH